MDHFVITITRGYGSGGRTVGKMLAKELGIPFYDRELLRMASDESGINEQLFGKADETVKKGILPKISKSPYKGELIPPDSEGFVSDQNLFNYMAKVIKELADKESCIIVGRCGDYILKEYKNVLNLFVHAPLESCIDTLTTMYPGTRKELKKKILTIDKDRSEYYKYFTGREWNNAENYDLCINTSELNFQQVVDLVKAYIEIKK